MHRSVVLTALLSALALASPVINRKQKRELVIVTAYDVVYEYVYVTATEGAPAASTSSTSTSTTTTSTSSTAATVPSAQSNAQSNGPSKQSQPHKKPAPIPAPPAASPSSSTTTVPTTTQASSPGVATTYQEAVLLHHNLHRANHSAPNLAWSDELASIANTIASSCIYAHNRDVTFSLGGYGQNIGAGTPADQVTDMLTNSMYNGEMPWYAQYYGDVNPDFTNFLHWGHFSQMVWKSTTLVGCATVTCGSLQNIDSSLIAPYLTVCNYYPPGNMGGEYGDNVGAPRGAATIDGDYGVEL